MNRVSGRLLGALATVVVLAIVATVVAVIVVRHERHMSITAYFSESNGIYVGNHVDILGLPVGTVSSVTPEPHDVKVVLRLPKGTKVPVGAQAYIVPPSVISDRYVGLSPAWNGGKTLTNGAVLPLTRTHVPAEFDDLVGSLTTLFNALGPKEANAKGTVGRLIRVLSANLDGNGTKIHSTIEGLSSATSALTSDRGGLATVITSLDTLSKNLAARDALIGSFNTDLAGASSQLASERGDITSVVTNLSGGLVDLAAFLKTHQSELHGTLQDLVTTTTVLLSHQRALIETLDNLPLASQNLTRVNHGGSILVKQANAGNDQVLATTLKPVCAVLPTLCQALTTVPLGVPSGSGLGGLFGARK